jgi:hypothetical protein
MIKTRITPKHISEKTNLKRLGKITLLMSKRHVVDIIPRHVIAHFRTKFAPTLRHHSPTFVHIVLGEIQPLEVQLRRRRRPQECERHRLAVWLSPVPREVDGVHRDAFCNDFHRFLNAAGLGCEIFFSDSGLPLLELTL